MPPKKRSCFGSGKSNSERHRILSARTQNARAGESEEQRTERIEAHLIRQAAARAAESQEERTARVEADRAHHIVTRARELQEERNARLEVNRTRIAIARAAESIEERNARYETNRIRQAVVRDTESEEDRSERIEVDRRRIAAARAVESMEERKARMEGDRIRHTLARDTESEEVRSSRIEVSHTRIAAESMEERNARIQANRIQQAIARAAESQEEQSVRVQLERTRQAARRNRENTELQDHTTSTLEGAAFGYNVVNASRISEKFVIGRMVNACPHCSALKWSGESKGMCCCNGKVTLPVLQTPPEPLHSLMCYENSDKSKHFLDNLRKYNSCFQMTSFGSTSIVNEPGFMPTFKVQGQVYHRIGAMLPLENEEHKFLQIYFMGDELAQAEHRCANIPGTHQDIILELQQFLKNNNNYVQCFKTVLDRMPTDDYKVVIRADKTPAGEHARRYNAPVVNEVAIIIAGNEFQQRDIVLQKRDNQLKRVTETHRSYDALQYPIIFWQGEDGYNFLIKQIDPTTGIYVDKKVSAMNFYSYRLMIRGQSFNHILRCRQLFHQFVVDMFAKIESERLLYVRLNQKKLRVEEYIHLRDAMNNDADSTEIGQLVILPSTFTGSPRYMHEYTQDAMTYVRSYGRPDLFITFTCNPKWPEIEIELMVGQKQYDRHDLTARVFRQKLIRLMNAITKSHIFGQCRCWMYSIEWQKRGLPHAHILLWLINKIMPNQVDNVICAEIPDPEQDPVLFEVIVKQMIHGPCGSLNPTSMCMKEGKCTKKYPRNLIKETQTGTDGYPLYRRRCVEDGGRLAKIKVKVGNSYRDVDIDNRWVVPYCPLLCRIFQAHINVEYCNSVKSIKYICKYVNKGSDQAVFNLQNERFVISEIDNYQMGRYISSNEAIWRIFDFPIHERYPTVVHLSVHLENGQRVYFTEENVRDRIREPPKTTLTAFMQLCENDDFARTLLYCEVPKFYTWNTKDKIFNRRKKGLAVAGHPEIRSSDALGRVYTVHPNNFECYFLRILLHTVRGPTSFQALRTVDGEIFNTYRQACQRRGLLEDDAHWDATMFEAAATKSPKSLRELFAVLICNCGVGDTMKLWDTHKESLTEDIHMQVKRQNPDLEVVLSPAMFNAALILIEDRVLEMIGKRIKDIGLPDPERNSNTLSTDIIRETSYNAEELRSYISTNEPLLTEDQRAAYIAILDEVQENNGIIFFLDAPGGTGKTFLIKLILARVRENSKIAIAVASSGIAATLLPGGRTAHSSFKLPLNLARTESPLCNITKSSEKAKVLQQCQVIVWDECTMSHKNALEALDRTLRDLRRNDLVMGGVVVVLAGDFRQTLPIIPKGTIADEIKACLKSSHLWGHVVTLPLTTNMRIHLQGNISDGQFAQHLLNIGNGLIPVNPETGLITIEETFCRAVGSIEELKERVFPSIQQRFTDHKWLCQRAILAPKNDSVDIINLQIQEQLPGECISYKSVDTVVDNNEAVHYPIEFLNSLQPSGMPPHNLILKIGSPIMLLRNLNPPRLCNGTRLTVKKLQPHIIEATILTGCAEGENVFIPRIPLIPSDMPFEFKRLQFPVRLAFAMSINKAQGQSLQVAGVNLEYPCFSHGQFYVACSRVGSASCLYVFAPNQETRNIVYQAALR